MIENSSHDRSIYRAMRDANSTCLQRSCMQVADQTTDLTEFPPCPCFCINQSEVDMGRVGAKWSNED